MLFLIDPAQLQAAVGQAEAALAQAEANYANAHAACGRARARSRRRNSSRSPTSTTRWPPNAAAPPRCSRQGRAWTTARINLGYATVRAPISGRAGKQQVTEGALVGQGDATLLTTVDQIDPLYVDFSVGVADLDARAPQAERRQAQRRYRSLLPDGTRYDASRCSSISPVTWWIRRPARSRCARACQTPTSACCRAPSSRVAAALGEQRQRLRHPADRRAARCQGAYVLVVGHRRQGRAQGRDVTDRQDGADWLVSRAWPRRPGDRVGPAARAAGRSRPRRCRGTGQQARAARAAPAATKG